VTNKQSKGAHVRAHACVVIYYV